MRSAAKGLAAAVPIRQGGGGLAANRGLSTGMLSRPLNWPRDSGLALRSRSAVWDGCGRGQRRGYIHWLKAQPDDYELPIATMPEDMDFVMKKDPKQLNFFENYWYWRLRAETSLLDAESLPKKSYKQLTRDMGLQTINRESEHMCAMLELYEYLRSAHFVGPFGTVKNPVLVPSVADSRVVGCTGGTGDEEHLALYFHCRAGFLYRCAECDQIFMHVRVIYSLPDGEDPFPVDPEVNDVFDTNLLEKNQLMYNLGDYHRWPAGDWMNTQLFLKGKLGNRPVEKGQELLDNLKPRHVQSIPF